MWVLIGASGCMTDLSLQVKALGNGVIRQEDIDDMEPSLIFAIPRLMIVQYVDVAVSRPTVAPT